MDKKIRKDSASEQVTPTTPKKKNVLIIVLAAVIGVLSAGILGFAVLVGTDGISGLDNLKKPFTPTLKEDYGPSVPTTNDSQATEPQATEPQATEPTEPTEPLKSYTVSAEEADAVKDLVVATVGEESLTNAFLQPYYVISVQNFLQNNYYYLYYYGYDLSKPMDQLIIDPETNQTFQEYLLDGALQNWYMYSAIYQFGTTDEENGYQLSEIGQEYVNNLPQFVDEMSVASGYETAEEFVKNQIGVTASVEGLLNYMEKEYYYLCYSSYLQEKYNPTMEEIEEYFTKNELAYANNGLTKECEDVVNFRHILIQPEPGTTGEDGTVTYSEEEWEQARLKAQELLDSWLSGDADEISFMDLANANTDDTSSNTTGGLCTGVLKGNFGDEIDQWCFAEERQYGEATIIKAADGYHIIFFIAQEPQWVQVAREDYVTQTIYDLFEDVMVQYPLDIDFDKIALSN